ISRDFAHVAVCLQYLHSFPTRRSSDLLEVDHQLELGRELHRQLGRLCAAQDAVDITRAVAKLKLWIRRVGQSFNFATARVMSTRSEEHTSELQSRGHLVCRLLLEKKNN